MLALQFEPGCAYKMCALKKCAFLVILNFYKLGLYMVIQMLEVVNTFDLQDAEDMNTNYSRNLRTLNKLEPIAKARVWTS